MDCMGTMVFIFTVVFCLGMFGTSQRVTIVVVFPSRMPMGNLEGSNHVFPYDTTLMVQKSCTS